MNFVVNLVSMLSGILIIKEVFKWFVIDCLYKRHRKIDGAKSLTSYEYDKNYQLKKLLDYRDTGKTDRYTNFWLRIFL